ncbi:MAG: hypothetical protein GY855_05775 [candidate division Zixibacteria bacterium]|nr:hypothetical protein [candidate division Zixibacteria bacterium]
MKRALVLSGGGAKGCFQVGALDYLINQKGLDFDIICGVSVGSLNASIVAQGDYETLKKVWLEIGSPDDIFKKRTFGWLGALLGKDSLYNNEPLWEKIDKHVDQSKIINSGKHLRIGVVSLYTGQYYSVSEIHSSLKRLILASTTIPVAFSPINVSSELMSMVDGGVRNMTPLKEAIDLGADEIYIILCSPTELEKTKKDYGATIEIALRTLEILTNETFRNDIHTCLEYNERPDKKVIDLKIIRPVTEVCGTLSFESSAIRAGMEMGYREAEKVLDLPEPL